ncbi:MAG: N-formylglutamate amidohydrolase [Alphaproteobacteria bacterium]|nr:N-formylglutamate amidohydrolase [Alphaproteobacteria bacterium]
MTKLDNRLLLELNEAACVAVHNPGGLSPFLILGDHAGNAIPRKLAALELSAPDRARHIAWDIGVRGLGEALANALDAVYIHQHYSRLVIDCNREPMSAQAIPAISDGSAVPGNERLLNGDRVARITEIHKPYHDRITAELTRRAEADHPTILIALHSFTPTMTRIPRPWHIGILYSGGDTRFATMLLNQLGLEPDIITGDNQPYRMDNTDYTVPRHAFANRLPYVELEVRQNLIAEAKGQLFWSNRLCAVLETAQQGFCN